MCVALNMLPTVNEVENADDVYIPVPPPRSAPPPAPSAAQASSLMGSAELTSRLYRVSQMIRDPATPVDAVPSLVRPSQSWHRAGRLIKQSLGFRDNANVVFDASLPLQRRVDALQQLERRLAIDPSRQYLAAALRKRQDGAYASLGDRVLTEVYITSETVFDYLTPPPHESHVLLTPVICFVCVVAFCYMAGAFLPYLQAVQQATCATPGDLYAPAGIGHYVIGDFKRSWCLPGNPWQFDQGFLALWGGRYIPFLRHRWYTFVTSAFVHRSCLHLTSNIILFVTTAREIERRYGQLRFLLLWLNAAVGSSLFGAVTEHNCNVVAGLSGSIFGVIALYMLDIWATRAKRQVLILRVSALVFGLCAIFLGFVVTPQSFSHLTHLGGVLFGILPAFLFQTHVSENEKVEAWLPVVAGIILSLLYIICFSVLYSHTMENVTCGLLL